MNKKAMEGLAEYKRKVAAGEIEVTKARNPIEKSEDNPKSKALAVNAKCYECIYDTSSPGNWKDQVRGCTCVSCPLFKVRPQ